MIKHWVGNILTMLLLLVLLLVVVIYGFSSVGRMNLPTSDSFTGGG